MVLPPALGAYPGNGAELFSVWAPRRTPPQSGEPVLKPLRSTIILTHPLADPAASKE